MRPNVTAALFVLTGAAAGWLATGAAATDAGMAAANQVSQASYTDFLDNWLYTHAGDDRGFGPEHDLARDNIEMFFVLYGLDVELHPFQYQSTTYYNVVGTMTGTVHPDQEYIVGAHYDSVNNPGADDDASGTALVLEAARILSQYDSAYTIRFMAFDREEQGLIGSSAYVADHAGADILGMVQADMVAYNTGANSTDIYAGSAGSTPLQVDLVDAVSEYGDGLTPVQASNPPGGSDHQPFANAGYQAVVITEDWGNPYYHTPQDTFDTLDFAYGTRMTRSVVGWLVDAAEVDVPYDGLSFTLPDGTPEYVDPDGGTTIRVEVVGVGTEVPQPGSGLLHYDTGDGWQSVPMEVVSPNVYDAVLPWTDCPDEILYYFSADSMTSTTYTEPHDAPAGHYSSIAAYGMIVGFYEDFETTIGWTAENLGATSGDWEVGVPVDDPGWDYDPAFDSDGSGQCYLTQNQVGNTDVDDGAVRLTSALFDMSNGGILAYDYYLYLTNSAGGVDKLLVEASNGSTPWIEVARHDTSGGLNWRTHEITTAELTAAGVPPSNRMAVRFTANDADPQSIVEAGIDALRIYDFDCEDPCPADVNGDGAVDVVDFLGLLAAWGDPGGPADINDDGSVDVVDFLQLLSEWGPCP
ncbi:MAG: M20/M25/M40 family metallo-hydrolase [Planctomycetota bacterium]|jgi:hypothetical protein